MCKLNTGTIFSGPTLGIWDSCIVQNFDDVSAYAWLSMECSMGRICCSERLVTYGNHVSIPSSRKQSFMRVLWKPLTAIDLMHGLIFLLQAQDHPIAIYLKTRRAWCSVCDEEVFPNSIISRDMDNLVRRTKRVTEHVHERILTQEIIRNPRLGLTFHHDTRIGNYWTRST